MPSIEISSTNSSSSTTIGASTVAVVAGASVVTVSFSISASVAAGGPPVRRLEGVGRNSQTDRCVRQVASTILCRRPIRFPNCNSNAIA